MNVILTKRMSDDWSGVDLYQNCKHRIGSYFKRSGKIYTGDFSDVDKDRFEKALGENLAEKINQELNPFWVNYHILLDSKNKLVLDTDNIKDEFDVKFLEKHKDVAMGYTDRKPGTHYVLIKEQDEAEVINKRAQIKIKATIEYGKLTPEQMRKALRLYGHNSKSISNEITQSTLFRLVEDDPAKFITLWVENPNKETHFLIEEAIGNNVIRNEKTIYKYGTDIIGYTLEEAIDYLKNPSNANVRLAIISQVEGKKEVDAPAEVRTTETQFKTLLKEIEEDETVNIDEKAIEPEEISGDKETVESTTKEDKKPSKKAPTSSKKNKE